MQKNRRFSRFMPVLTLMGSLMIAGPAWAQAHTSPGVEVEVEGSVEEVVGKLSKAVADGGMMVMGELHQGNVLSMTGLRVESETIFVGSPTVGKNLFTADPAAGLVVPIRVNVYANAAGQTVVSYIPPSQLLSGFNNPMINEIAEMLDGKLQMMTHMLAN